MMNNCKYCMSMIFDVTNVKFKVVFTRGLHIDLSSRLMLVNEYGNTRIIHCNNYCYTVFNERFDVVHMTGCKCLCLINDAIRCLMNENVGGEVSVQYVNVNSISVKFNVRAGVKNKIAGLSDRIHQKFVIRHPLQFPGTVIKMGCSNASVSIFNTGRAIGCGFKRYGQIVNFIFE